MKIKYTKWIVALTMTAMSVGMTAFSFEQPNVELPAAETFEEEALEARLEEKEEEDFGEIQKSGLTVFPEGDSESESVTAAGNVKDALGEEKPEEVKLIDIPLEINTDSGIEDLINAYLSAKLLCNIEDFEGIVTDTQLIELDKLQRKTEYVETYENIKIYIKPAEGDVDYIAYVYQELKITSIDTLAPALDEILIRYDDTGRPQVVLGEISDETSEYVAMARQREDVVELIEDVGEKLIASMKADEALAEFYSKLGSAGN